MKKSKIVILIIIGILVIMNATLLVLIILRGSGEEEKTEKRTTEARTTEETTTEEPTTEATTESVNRFPDRANADTGSGDKKTLSEGDVAPDFTADLVNGGTFKLSDYDDKIVLLNFWATWCGPCVREMPAFQRLLEDGDSDLEIICINCGDDKSTVDSFVDDEGYTFNIGYDVDRRIEAYYPTNGIPYTLVINKGVIEKIYVGAMDADTQYTEYRNAINECR